MISVQATQIHDLRAGYKKYMISDQVSRDMISEQDTKKCDHRTGLKDTRSHRRMLKRQLATDGSPSWLQGVKHKKHVRSNI